MNPAETPDRTATLRQALRPDATPRRRWRHALLLGSAVLLWALLMSPLLSWGLPDTSRDELLFGGEPPWDPARYRIESDLSELSGRQAGADTDLNPLPHDDRLVNLTADEAARAEILRRYRLFSRQPDEMIILRALQRMKPREWDFDPRLYQYGGGYIYLVGFGLAWAAMIGKLHVTSDAGYYLAHPEAFARFYVVARLVSLAFGALTLIAVHRLARRAASRTTAWIVLVGVAASPLFITAVLEAKPHLPAACLTLWATLSALDYRLRHRLRDALRLGAQAGYAFGLVLTGCTAALLWPGLLALTPAPRRRAIWALLLAGTVALAVYGATNPYVVAHSLGNRAALDSNLSNSLVMYAGQMQQAAAGAWRTVQLLSEGCGLGMLLGGLIGLALLVRRHRRDVLLVVLPGLGMLLASVLLGAGKPAEFARFLILPALLVIVSAGVLVTESGRRRWWLGVAVGLVMLGTMRTPAYLRAFITDASGPDESRFVAGRALAQMMAPGDTLGLLQEPAPYAVPPVDFAHRSVWLLPARRPEGLDASTLPDWLVFTADAPNVTRGAWWHEYYRLQDQYPPASAPLARICWANKPVFVYRRIAAASDGADSAGP